MRTHIKDRSSILAKLGIKELNDMQQESGETIASKKDVILLSPTGTGKTLAFLLPIIESLDADSTSVQVLIVAPSRELAIQIESVAREMGSGYKTNVVYGGRAIAKDKIDLQHNPAILIGTPGRLADHIRRESFAIDQIKTVVLDEFDKSLEIGFEEDMREISEELTSVSQYILTSATAAISLPSFVPLRDPSELNYLQDPNQGLKIKKIISPEKDKLSTLLDLVRHIGDQHMIIFCNFKDSIERVSGYLEDHGIMHGCFYGGMEQKDRERILIKFRNSTIKILLATDLAARGLDVAEIQAIIHYHMPLREQEFIHRNGRTARMNKDGAAYVIMWKDDEIPHFLEECKTEELVHADQDFVNPTMTTLFISGGRRDKISKGDIVGMMLKKTSLEKDELGLIELKPECAFVAVTKSKAKHVIATLNNTSVKKRKIRVYQV